MSKHNCLFCKIINNEIPNYRIYEDDNYVAFLDAFPAVEGYTLVVPKKHCRWVWDVENIGKYFEVCRKIARHFQKVTNDDRVYSMVIGEEVPHAHIRIVPGNDEKFNQELYKFLERTQQKNMLDKETGERLMKKFKL